jgi:hypothetical protein
MPPRFAVTAPLAAIIVLAVAACAGAPAVPASPSPTPPVATQAVPSPSPTSAATPAPTAAETPIVGGVDGDAGGPMLTIEQLDEDTILATIADPRAKAWRITVAGTGDLGGDRWELVAEVGDVGPVISAIEIRGGSVVDVLDLTPYWNGTAAAGGCHATLEVCIDSGGFEIPEGDGLFSVRLELPQGQVPLVIRGATARWDGEPFVLGPWTETEAFPWGEG